jgi:hypothetical protein
MATNVRTTARGMVLPHFTLVSLDLSRLRSIRAHRALVQVALVSAVAIAAVLVAAVLTYAGAPLWLAAVFAATAIVALVLQELGTPERVGRDFYRET